MALSKATTSEVTTETPINFLLVGNPGAGKSTLLNSLIGEVIFKSGVSFGGGLTYKFDEKRHGIHTYMDTPGLSDVKLRKQAAVAITEALKKGGYFKIIFVVTLEAGRVRPADKTTINLILESAPITDYAIVINKLSKPLFKQLTQNPENKDPSPLQEVCAELFSGENATQWVLPIPKVADLEDEENQVTELPDIVHKFLHDMPAVCIREEDVTAVRQDKFDEMTEKFEKMLAEMKSDNQKLRDQMSSKDAEVRSLQARIDAMTKKQDGCCMM